ncbi:MAG: 4'-phosphopantetheinyl transferase superfamily protein, partial [Desulfobacteraceae bacterium]|nr:4'-phosphopantetheinyl transferase superfamily protein [Desulfobacteraceae bacterium]
IDIEPRTEPKETKWLQAAFSEHELKQWGTTYQQLLPLWCAKEAAAKASGTGFTENPVHWCIQDISDQRRQVSVFHANTSYQVRLWSTAEEILAVCCH